MSTPHHTDPELLLGFHLRLLDDDSAEHVATAIGQSAEAAQRSRNLGEWIGLLDHYQTPEPPDGLVHRIMARVEQPVPFRAAEPASSLPPASDRGVLRRPFFSLREVVALAACITFFIGVIVPSVARNRAQARQAVCAANLGGIYSGLAQYAASYNGSMPQVAGFLPGINWLQASTQPPAARMPNSRNRYLVVRLRFVKPQNFICPEAEAARPMDPARIDQYDDFPSVANCSFDSQNMAGPTLPLGAGRCVPIYADRNPLFEGGKVNAIGPAEPNSRSHRGLGQTVLCSDGRVLWTTSPLFGSRPDNIWQVDGVTEYTGTEYQRHPADAFVIP